MTLKHVGTFAEAIVLARDTLKQVPPDPNGKVPIVPGLRDYAEKCSGLKISIHKDCQVQEHTRGMVLRYKDHASIRVCPDLNLCWTRFVVCKELMHLLVDVDPSCFAADPVEQLTTLLMANQLSAQMTSEQYAFVAALEYMLPHDRRPATCNGHTSFMKLAEQFKVPRLYVEFVYGPTYSMILKKVG